MLASMFLAIFVCGCQKQPISDFDGVPHTFSVAEVAGRWIGFTTSDTDLWRLELKTDGTGVLIQAYTGTTNAETMRFEIRRSDIATNNVLTCDFSRGGTNASLEQAWPVKMTGKVTGTQLKALLRNGEGGWKENIVFWREKDFDDKLKALRQ
jgi:hypothetical protein